MPKTTSPKPPIHDLIVDTREPADLCWVLQGYGFTTHRVALDSGDYLWVTKDNKSVGVERKTASDLLGSIAERQGNKRSRIVNQLSRLRKAYDHPVLLIEGYLRYNRGKVTVENRKTKWNWDAVDNLLLSVQRGGVSVVHAAKGHLAERLDSLQHYYDKKRHELELREKD